MAAISNIIKNKIIVNTENIKIISKKDNGDKHNETDLKIIIGKIVVNIKNYIFYSYTIPINEIIEHSICFVLGQSNLKKE